MITAEHLAGVGTIRIFISYSARTKDEVELSDCLIDFFSSAFALPPKAIFAYTAPGHGVKSGGHLFDELKRALADSEVVLAVATKAASESSYSQFEAAASDLAGKYRVPLLPDPSFHTHVAAVFQEIAARNLGSIGELCQLLEDMKTPLGIAAVQPACLWITKAERVVDAARAVAGKIAPEVEVSQLQQRAVTSETRVRQLRNAGATAGLLALVALLAVSILWRREHAQRTSLERTQDSLITRNKELASDLESARGEITAVNRRSVYLPAVQIDGRVLTSSGTAVERALVVACAALSYPASMHPSDNHVCPEELRLNAETGSDGEFSIDLHSLPPLPDKLAQAFGNSPLREFWLTAQHETKGSVLSRVKPVNVVSLQLRH